MKKKFPCGHEGKGKYCHRCDETEKRALRGTDPDTDRATKIVEFKTKSTNARTEDKRNRLVKSAEDVIDLSAIKHLPVLQNKARRILEQIEKGADYRSFLGKRLNSSNNEVIAVPLGYSHRILFRDKPLRPLSLVSHEQYNNLFTSKLP